MKNLIQFTCIVFLISLYSSNVFSQRGYYEQELEMPFQPRFTLGSSYYSSQGDISGPKTGNLLGNIGFNAGVRFNVARNTDVSLLFNRFKLSESSATQFSSELRSFGLFFDYTFNNIFKKTRISPFARVGLQSISYKTVYWDEEDVRTVYPSESSIASLFGAGFALDVSERIRLDISVNNIINTSDIDMDPVEGNDNMMMVNFAIHYDFFTRIPKNKNTIDDSFYSDVNFQALDLEDTDGDLVADIDDECPNTPQGVKVDERGCPFDSDNDGVPNYLDKQLNTRNGALVDEQGVELTEEKYEGMYEYLAASRKYAAIYNQSEIKEGDYKDINDYLIAKANEFNKEYNESTDSENVVQGLRYKIQIAKYNTDVPEDIQVKLLSVDDLESFTQDDGYVIYMVGSYPSMETVLNRSNALEVQGFDEIYIMVDNNGVISKYSPPAPPAPPVPPVPAEENIVKEKVIEKITNTEPIYRVQIGAYDKKLAQEVFVGVNNVVHIKDKDGLIKYMAGSFSDKKKAIEYMFEMRARGFKDAFVVGFVNGERSIEYFAPNKKETNYKNSKVMQEPESIEENISFIVQIMVGPENLNADQMQKLNSLGEIKKERKGEMYRYFAGTYNSIDAANKRLNEVKKKGYLDAFVFAKYNGKRITIKEANQIINK